MALFWCIMHAEPSPGSALFSGSHGCHVLGTGNVAFLSQMLMDMPRCRVHFSSREMASMQMQVIDIMMCFWL